MARIERGQHGYMAYPFLKSSTPHGRGRRTRTFCGSGRDPSAEARYCARMPA